MVGPDAIVSCHVEINATGAWIPQVSTMGMTEIMK